MITSPFRLFLSTLLLCLGVVSAAYATHIVGGEVTYRCLGNNRYEIKVSVYRDCDTGVPWFDNPASVGVFDSSNTLLQDLRLPLRNNDTLDLFLTDTCYVAPPNVCIHTTTYIDTVTLPYRAGGYTLVYQRCCRNQDIVNIISPLSTGATYTAYISEAALTSCNSSPVFIDYPPVYLCAGVPIVFDHSARDIDGDSIVYELCAPFDGATTLDPMPQPPYNPPYDSVRWQGIYSTNNMLGGPDSFRIDPITGMLSGTPTILGVFVVGVRAKEYRNGVLIASIQRDFQYAVGTCGRRSNAAFFAPNVVCDNALMVQFMNSSQAQPPSYRWNFGDNTTLGDTSILENPIYIYPDTGSYQIQLIVAPNSTCADTFARTVHIQKQSLHIDFTRSTPACTNTGTLHFNDRSTDTLSRIVRWHWDFGIPNTLFDTANIPSPVYSYGSSGTYIISLMVQSANGCVDTLYDTLHLELPTVNIPDTTWLCANELSTRLNPSGNPSYQYAWSPPIGLSATNVASPLATYDSMPRTYYVTITIPSLNGLVCTYIDSTVLASYPPFTVDIQADTATCSSSIWLEAVSNQPITTDWSFYPQFDSIFSTNNPTLVPLPAGNTPIYLAAYNRAHCLIRDTIVITSAFFPVQTSFGITRLQCGNPYSILCTDLSVDTSRGQVVSRQWTVTSSVLPNALTSTATNPTFSFTQSGVYDITLSTTTSQTCSGFAQSRITIAVPSITTSDSIGICAGTSSVVLNAGGDPTLRYRWSPSTGLSSTTAASPVCNTNTTRTYFVTVTAINGTDTCIGYDTVKVVRPAPLSLNVPSSSTFCGATATLTASPNRPVRGYEWSGDNSFFTILSRSNPFTVTPTVFPTSGYYVRGTDYYGCTATAFAVVTQRTTPVNVQFGYSILQCTDTLRVQFNNLTIDTTGTTIVSSQWTTSNGQTSTLRNPVFTFTQSGTYNIVLTVRLANGCTGTLTRAIDFNVSNITTTRTVVACHGQTSTVLNPNGNPNLTYTWSPAAGLSSTTIASPTATPPSYPFVYNVTITGANGVDACYSVLNVTLLQPPPVVANLPPDSTFCADPFTLVAQTQNAARLEWAFNSAFSPIVVANANPINLNFGGLPDSARIYVRAIDNYGCTAVDSIYIRHIIAPVPVQFTPSIIQCGEALDIAFNAHISSSSTILNYHWIFSNGQTSNAYNPRTQYYQSGTYPVSLTVRDIRGCEGTYRDTLQFDLPSITSPNIVPVCSLDSVVLNPYGNQNLTYTWSPAAHLSSPTAVSPIATPTQNTTYYVTITANNSFGVCSVVDSVGIGVTGVDLELASDTTVCINRITLTAQSTNATRYWWALDNNIALVIGTNATLTTNINTNRWFYAAVMDAYGCYAMDSIYIRVAPSTFPVQFAMSGVGCSDSLQVQFTNQTDTTGRGIVGWAWNFGDGGISTAPNPLHAYQQSGNYSISLVARTQSGCDAQTNRPIQVQIITPPSLADTIPVCVGDSIQLNPNDVSGVAYHWTPATYLDLAYNNNPTASPPVSTLYTAVYPLYYWLNGVLDSCQNSRSTYVSVISAPTLSVWSDGNVCDSIATLLANSNAAVEWSFYPNFSPIATRGDSVALLIPTDSVHLFVRAIAGNAHCSVIDSVWETRHDAKVALHSITLDCATPIGTLEAINERPNDVLVAYQWTPASDILTGQNTPLVEIQPTASQSYAVRVQNQYGCTDSASVWVNVHNTLPSLQIYASRDTIALGDTLQLVCNYDPAYQYQWQANPSLSSTIIYNPIATPTTDQTYYLTVTTPDGCLATDSIRVAVRTKSGLCDETTAFVPNAFTPNQDGLNDVLFVRGQNITELYFAVYNRWGELVFQTTSQQKGWNGVYNGVLLSPDVYGYYLKYRCLDGKEHFQKGNVTLLR